MAQAAVQAFIDRWSESGASERANYQLYLSELCDLLEVPRPDPQRADEAGNAYVFEKGVTFRHPDGSASLGRIDLYKRGCFVLEAKQGADPVAPPLFGTRSPARQGHGQRGTVRWDQAMVAARAQAERYAKALPTAEGWPPFLVVVDVGHSLELYADFSGQGKAYLQFPNVQRFRIKLTDLADPTVRETLRRVWLEPLSLDPSLHSARVTKEVAGKMAVLARSLEEAGHGADQTSAFLMRCLFSMFAEDVHLLPQRAFTTELDRLRGRADRAVVVLPLLWDEMNRGGFSTRLMTDIPVFNGGLFASSEALPLTEAQLELLLDAARTDWSEVEPAIFGTLIERALNPRERHKLGAHYTPRSYVERLVLPTVMEPLRAEWTQVRTAAFAMASLGDTPGACKQMEEFHGRLCRLRFLDPACGSGNFLYVTMEHVKRLEGEILDALAQLGQGLNMFQASTAEGHIVTPEQFLGLELNPRAAAVARVVLWIGYLQWHFRTRGQVLPPQPVLRGGSNIQCRDAVLAFDGDPEPVFDAEGKPVSHWDGLTFKRHPATGEEVPDEQARTLVFNYRNPRRAEWPEADFVVGNPPFLGNHRMRQVLGEGYTSALRKAWDEVQESVDLVMFWWHKAALLLRDGRIRAFGFITTNSLTQKNCRRVLEYHLGAPDNPLSLAFAVPDHPWVDSAEGAAVRIAMTVGQRGRLPGRLLQVAKETADAEGAVRVEFQVQQGLINPDLTVGVDLTTAQPLRANAGICSPGVKLHGAGFIVTPEEATRLGLGRIPGLERHIRHYRNGRDLAARIRGVMVIDLFGLTAPEVRDRFPEVYQWVLERVKPERDTNNRATYAQNWWIFGEPRKDLRPALEGLSRFIATVETSKHRFFVFLGQEILPDNMLVSLATPMPPV